MKTGNFRINANKHAVVVGGSMAGLLTAAALSRHFSRITVIERDQYPFQPKVRAGVPQAHRVHALLLRGLHVVEHFFPGIRDDFLQHGASLLDTAAAWLQSLGCSRPPETLVDGHMGYASRLYRRKPASDAPWRLTYSQAAPPAVCRIGLALPIEDDLG